MSMKDKIFEQISKVMEVEVNDISLDSTPDTLANWDSMRHMNLILAFEMEFSVEIPPEKIVEMLSVQLIIDTVSELVA